MKTYKEMYELQQEHEVESYFYIQENYDRIVEELGDNLESYDDGEDYWIVDIKYKRKED